MVPGYKFKRKLNIQKNDRAQSRGSIVQLDKVQLLLCPSERHITQYFSYTSILPKLCSWESHLNINYITATLCLACLTS